MTNVSNKQEYKQNRLIMDIEKKCQWCGKTFSLLRMSQRCVNDSQDYCK